MLEAVTGDLGVQRQGTTVGEGEVRDGVLERWGTEVPAEEPEFFELGVAGKTGLGNIANCEPDIGFVELAVIEVWK